MPKYTEDKVLHLACDEAGKGYFEMNANEKPAKGFRMTDLQRITKDLQNLGLLETTGEVKKGKIRFYATAKGKVHYLAEKVAYRKARQKKEGGQAIAIQLLEAKLAEAEKELAKTK